MTITGHTTETGFLNYLKITKTEHTKKLREFWLKQSEENNFGKMNM